MPSRLPHTTMIEHSPKPAQEISLAYLGDECNNVANLLVAARALMGMDVRLVSPSALRTSAELIEAATGVAARTGATISQTEDVEQGIAGVDFGVGLRGLGGDSEGQWQP